ncbi:hypothetical protein NliqN6_6835 [Naganishia liquefaciens]|uniref:SprT-like domain-containing protein n=1 Tax=Naganishia liquefaciens TaxID=104408 RepID=A0A8H3U0E8_9TREE|nr:hypothetical protein NliqN6_6835 [Naganishia liquefaciens]
MAATHELDELFAYLDQLELDERIEQEKIVVDDLHPAVAEAREAQNDTTVIKSLATSSGKLGNQQDILGQMTSLKNTEPAAQAFEGAPLTPPKLKKIVQFSAVTPMRTPQRKAPKLVFTPLRSVQPASLPSVQSSTEILKITKDGAQVALQSELKGAEVSPAGSSFRRSYVQDSPFAQARAQVESEGISDDLSEASFIIGASTCPSVRSDHSEPTENGQDLSKQAFDLDSPVTSPALPRRRLKKRVVYSSDEESEQSAVPTLSSLQANDVIDVEAIGEGPCTDPDVNQLEPVTQQTRTTRTKGQKKNDVAKFFDIMARSTGKDTEDEDSDDEGSLNDFIVDDDYVEYEDEVSEDGDAYVLTYSPTTPKPRKKAAPIPSIAVDLTETSDEDDTDPIPNVCIAPRPKPRPRNPPTKLQPTETPKKSRTERKSWNDNKQKLAMDIMRELDQLVFEEKLVKKWKVAPVWNNKLLTTAGRAHHKRIKQPDGSYDHEGRIELSEKVIDDEAKLKNTVAHEMCHLATWIITGEMKNPHGAVFKSWGKKVMKARKDIEVTTKHSYEIVYKYEWACVTEGCDAVYRRHSRSIDIETQACGKCRGRLRPLFKTRAGGAGSTPFQDFLKQNMKLAKAAMPKATHGEVMRALSERWKATGGAKTPTEIAQTGEDPIAAQRAHSEYWQVMSLQIRSLSIA